MEEANQNSEFKNFDFDKSKNKNEFSGDLLISLKKASYGKVKVLEDIEISQQELLPLSEILVLVKLH